MTDAYIPVKNETTLCEENTQSVNSTSTPARDCSNNITASTTSDGNSTTTESLSLNTDSIIASTDKNSLDSTNITYIPKECENRNTTTQECINSLTKLNEINDSDTVLKYVYKKNENDHTPHKSSGHVKNSLKRKRRDAPNNSNDVEAAQSAPVIVNYEIGEKPQDREPLSPRPELNSKNVLKNSDLADFNIETLHIEDAKPLNKDDEGRQKIRLNDASFHSNKNIPQPDSEEKVESEEYIEKEKHHKPSEESEESVERNDSSTRDVSNEQHSAESDERTPTTGQYIKTPQESKESDESYEKESSSYIKRDDSKESTEKDYNVNDDKAAYSSESRESNERENYKEDKLPYTSQRHNNHSSGKHDNVKSNLQEIPENSNESIEKEKSEENLSNDYNNNKNIKTNQNTSSPLSIQDVDIDDFSYERIQINDKGQIKPVKENPENDDSYAPVKSKHNVKSNPRSSDNYEIHPSVPGAHISLLVDRNNQKQKNDDEDKPSVEINDNRDESGEKWNGNLKSDKSSQDVPNSEEVDVADVQKTQHKNEAVKDDVKQEFERIPLNYNHNDKKKANSEDTKPEVKGSKDKADKEFYNEGTLPDILKTQNHNYDENLNFKFDDLTIKLPTIKLPEDILSYAYELPEYGKKNKNEETKQNYHNYKDDEAEDNTHEYKRSTDEEDEEDQNDQNDDAGYYGQYKKYPKNRNKKQKSNKKAPQNDEEEEDLYEKFVRERFGKQGSFDRRSEKLQDYRQHVPENLALYQQLKDVLKHTKEVQKEAEKSGDPNANYMWTLEYGEKL